MQTIKKVGTPTPPPETYDIVGLSKAELLVLAAVVGAGLDATGVNDVESEGYQILERIYDSMRDFRRGWLVDKVALKVYNDTVMERQMTKEEQDAFDRGRKQGYDEGYDDGVAHQAVVYDEGYEAGYFDVESKIVYDTYNQGYDDGYEAGYQAAKEDSLNTNNGID